VSKTMWRTLAISLCVFLAGGLVGANFAQDRPPQGRPAPGQIMPPTPTSSETRMGMWRGRPVTYQVINGRNIYEGDIILENVQPMPKPGQGGGLHSDSVGLANSNYLWPKVNGVAQIPYVIDGASTNQNLASAISTYNSTFAGVIQLVPRDGQANYIDINLGGTANGVCEANEGDANVGEQFITGASNCTIATILHEFGHVTGVWHEQSRTDAASYVTFNYANVIKGSIGNFLPAVDNDQQNFTPYDFASVMEYPAFSFSRNGGPPLESIPPGMPLSNLIGYSAADAEGIMRLYGVAPTQVTITSNPPGLQVMVDGSPVTTPMTYSWALNSSHTLAVATGVQTLNGTIVDSSDPIQPTIFYYTYGVWNDGGLQSHTITVTPGNGDAGFPSTAPQVATYSANFIQLVPYTAAIFPTGSGSVSVSPTPKSYGGASGVFFVARQQATLTASPANGYYFYEFNNSPYWLPGGLGANPKTFYVPDTGLFVDTTAEFTTYPIYAIDVTPDSFSSNLSVTVDGRSWSTPKNFSPDPGQAYDGSAWASGTMHNLEFFSGLEPFDVNTQFVFSTWTPGGTANPLTVTLPATSQSYIATLTPEFVPATNFNPCGGTGAITPASTMGGFYPSGTTLTYTETPTTTTPPGQWIFTGWTWDLTGTSPSEMLSPTDESLVYANFNTAAAPLTITSLNPPSVVAGSGQFVLTINGTGFTPQSGNAIEIVGFNFLSGPTFPVTFVSSTELQVTVPASAIVTPGTYLLYVENFPSNLPGTCAVFAHQPFFVSQGAGSGATTVTATPTSVTFPSTALNATSTGSTITVKNTGSSAATTIAISASSNFGQTNTCPVAPSTLAAGATCTISPTFTPNAVGSLSGNISVFDSASNSPQVVTLSGTATPAATTVTVTPTTYNFGAQAVGTTSQFQTFTVQNTGTAYTSIAISITGNFAQVNNCGNLLDAGASCTMDVTFTPTVAGPLSGSISVTDQATNSPQMVSLSGSGTGTVVVTPTPSSLTFPSQTVGTTSSSQSVTVKNTGAVATPLSIGAATGDFAQTNNCASTLASGSNCTLMVTFTPTMTGTRTGSISITDQATNSPQMVSLAGTGTSSAGTTVTVTPTSETFAAQAVGTTSAGKTVTVKNTGKVSTSLSIGTTGDFAAVGSGTTPCSGTLAAAASCTISVTFTPEGTGTLTGTVTATDNATNSPQTVSLTGTGVAGIVTVTTTPASETFAAQTVNTTSAGKVVTVKNTGNISTPVTISNPTGDFAQTNNCPTTLSAGASCSVTVTFTPTVTGTLTGSFTVTDNAMNSPQTVKLTGTGTEPVVITITPASEAFTSTAVGSTSTQKTITVKNAGSQSTAISITSSGDFAAATNTCTGTLSGGGTCTINEEFVPTATGAISGAITITDGATNSPQIVSLTGTGLAPVTFSPVSLAFGSETVGSTTVAKTVTMTNNLSSTLSGISLSASGNYTLASGTTCTSALGPAAHCTIAVTFTPTVSGSIDGAVTLNYSAAYSPVEVKLTGSGTGSSTSPLKFTPASLAFSSQAIATTSSPKTVTVQNTSTTLAVTISTIATSGNFTAVGSGATPCSNGFTLIASASCTLSVTFAPSIAGAIQGALVISDNNSTVGQQIVNLTGTAVLPITIAPTSLTFASQTVGTTSTAQTLTLTNNSNAVLTGLSFTGSGDFSVTAGVTTPCGTSLAAGAKCTLSVTFAPNKTGSITGAATISDSAVTSPQVVKLTGTGS
jgi:hypothetical protein